MSAYQAAVEWQDRQVSAAEAVSVVKPGDTVFVGTACAAPLSLIEALEAQFVPGVTLVHFITAAAGGDSPRTNYRHRVFYVGRDELALRESARVDYLPISLADVPTLFETGQLSLDVAMLQVTPPDPDGTCSLGISVDLSMAAALNARHGHRRGESSDASHGRRQPDPGRSDREVRNGRASADRVSA